MGWGGETHPDYLDQTSESYTLISEWGVTPLSLKGTGGAHPKMKLEGEPSQTTKKDNVRTTKKLTFPPQSESGCAPGTVLCKNKIAKEVFLSTPNKACKRFFFLHLYKILKPLPRTTLPSERNLSQKRRRRNRKISRHFYIFMMGLTHSGGHQFAGFIAHYRQSRHFLSLCTCDIEIATLWLFLPVYRANFLPNVVG